jgi:hypothetical protein
MINFIEVEQSVRKLKIQFLAEELDEKTFEDHLLDLIDVADDGYYWMFGHETERWFRYDYKGGQWIPDTPRDEVFESLNHHANSHSHAAEGQNITWQTVNLGWLIASLIILIAIGSIIYISV